MKKTVMHSSFTGAVWITIAIMLVFIIISFCIAEKIGANTASVIGGVLSAIATVFLGLIAIWQNTRYKKIADEANDRNVRPEIFLEYHGLLADEYYELPSVRFSPIRWPENEEFDESFLCACEVLDFPIINVVPLSLEYYQGEETISAYTEFDPQIDLGKIIKKGEKFRIMLPMHTPLCDVKLTIQYENIYGDKYIKTVNYIAPTIFEIPDASVHGTYASGRIYFKPAMKID